MAMILVGYGAYKISKKQSHEELLKGSVYKSQSKPRNKSKVIGSK